MKVVAELAARGHPNITATHPTTLEITKESSLTKNGDCIVAVAATKGLKDLSVDFRRVCMNDNSRILLEFCASGIVETVLGKGSCLLTLIDSEEIVIRKSRYVTDRTLMVEADKAASDLNRHLVQELQSSSTRIRIRLTATLWRVQWTIASKHISTLLGATSFIIRLKPNDSTLLPQA